MRAAGMGEPMHNLNNVLTACDIICDQLGMSFGSKKVKFFQPLLNLSLTCYSSGSHHCASCCLIGSQGNPQSTYEKILGQDLSRAKHTTTGNTEAKAK
jgi:hypothetical protein